MFKKQLFLILLSTITLSLPILSVSANNYTGYFFDASYNSATKAILGFNFSGSSPGTIPANRYIGPVLTLPGAWGVNGPSSYMYQNFHVIWTNGSVMWQPQIQQGNVNPPPYFPSTIRVGAYTDYYFFEKIEVSGSNVIFKSYEYPTVARWDSDTPNIRTYTTTLRGTDTDFLRGRDNNRLVGGVIWNFRYLQAGVETNGVTRTSTWRIHTGYMSYKSGTTWYYQTMTRTVGPLAVTTIYNNWPYCVGGEYLDATMSSISPTSITWDSSANQYTTEAQIWATGGTITPPVATPFS
jgi:hypothetical protein